MVWAADMLQTSHLSVLQSPEYWRESKRQVNFISDVAGFREMGQQSRMLEWLEEAFKKRKRDLLITHYVLSIENSVRQVLVPILKIRKQSHHEEKRFSLNS